MEPSLFQIGEAVSAFSHRQPKWSNFSWLYPRLSLSARLMEKVGVGSTHWWKDRYILPELCRCAIPYLLRLSSGVWRQYEEGFLRRLFSFLATRKSQISSFLPAQIISFLDGPCPSFSDERQNAKSRCAVLGIVDPGCNWNRDETFCHYQARIKTLLHKQKSISKDRPSSPPPLSQQTITRIKHMMEKLTTAQAECATACEALIPLLQKANPLREEFPKLVHNLHLLSDWTLSVRLAVDEALLEIPDTTTWEVHGEAQMQLIFERAEANYSQVTKDIAVAQSRAKEFEEEISALRRSSEQFLHTSLHTVDIAPVLPDSNPLYPKQTMILQRARQCIKQARAALRPGSGVPFSRREVEKELNRLLQLCHDLYREGTEISLMSAQLEELSHQIEQCLEEDRHRSALRKLLDECRMVQQSLLIAADSHDRCSQLLEQFSEFKKRRATASS